MEEEQVVEIDLNRTLNMEADGRDEELDATPVNGPTGNVNKSATGTGSPMDISEVSTNHNESRTALPNSLKTFTKRSPVKEDEGVFDDTADYFDGIKDFAEKIVDQCRDLLKSDVDDAVQLKVMTWMYSTLQQASTFAAHPLSAPPKLAAQPKMDSLSNGTVITAKTNKPVDVAVSTSQLPPLQNGINGHKEEEKAKDAGVEKTNHNGVNGVVAVEDEHLANGMDTDTNETTGATLTNGSPNGNLFPAPMPKTYSKTPQANKPTPKSSPSKPSANVELPENGVDEDASAEPLSTNSTSKSKGRGKQLGSRAKKYSSVIQEAPVEISPFPSPSVAKVASDEKETPRAQIKRDKVRSLVDAADEDILGETPEEKMKRVFSPKKKVGSVKKPVIVEEEDHDHESEAERLKTTEKSAGKTDSPKASTSDVQASDGNESPEPVTQKRGRGGSKAATAKVAATKKPVVKKSAPKPPAAKTSKRNSRVSVASVPTSEDGDDEEADDNPSTIESTKANHGSTKSRSGGKTADKSSEDVSEEQDEELESDEESSKTKATSKQPASKRGKKVSKVEDDEEPESEREVLYKVALPSKKALGRRGSKKTEDMPKPSPKKKVTAKKAVDEADEEGNNVSKAKLTKTASPKRGRKKEEEAKAQPSAKKKSATKDVEEVEEEEVDEDAFDEAPVPVKQAARPSKKSQSEKSTPVKPPRKSARAPRKTPTVEITSSAPNAELGEVVGKRKRGAPLVSDTPRKDQKTDMKMSPAADMESDEDVGVIQYIYVATSVAEPDRKRYQIKCHELGWNYLSEYNDQVTHLVVAATSSLAKRTVNLLEAMLLGAWIVDKKCIRNIAYEVALTNGTYLPGLDFSIQKGAFVPEKPHEIDGLNNLGAEHGPEKARQNRSTDAAKLFGGLTFYLKGDFARLKPADLEKLIKGGGGKISKTEPKKSSLKKDAKPFVYAKKENDAAFCRYFIVSEDAKSEEQPFLDKGCACVAPTWILDTVEGFTFADI